MSSLTNPVPGTGFAHFYYLCVKSVRRAFANYAKGRGRASRSEYWLFTFSYTVISILVAIPFYAIGIAFAIGFEVTGSWLFDTASQWSIIIGGYGANLVVIIPSVTILVRRLHDTNKSAHFLWLFVMPYLVGFLLLLATLVSSGAGIVFVVLIPLLVVSFAGPIVIFVFTLAASKPGPNRFGEPSDFWEDSIKR